MLLHADSVDSRHDPVISGYGRVRSRHYSVHSRPRAGETVNEWLITCDHKNGRFRINSFMMTCDHKKGRLRRNSSFIEYRSCLRILRLGSMQNKKNVLVQHSPSNDQPRKIRTQNVIYEIFENYNLSGKFFLRSRNAVADIVSPRSW
jgi:hypothetical protein